jgi:hypothetical protein
MKSSEPVYSMGTNKTSQLVVLILKKGPGEKLSATLHVMWPCLEFGTQEAAGKTDYTGFRAFFRFLVVL